MTIEKLENKICLYRGIAEKDIKRDPILKADSENPKLYGYAKRLKCNGYDDKYVQYKQLKEHNLL
jgi:hypothetical protein